MKLKFVWLILLCFCTGILSSELSVYESMKHRQSLRSSAMAGAVTAVAEPESALLQNPAALSVPGSYIGLQFLDTDNALLLRNKNLIFYTSPFGYTYAEELASDGDSLVSHRFGFAYKDVNGMSWGLNYKSLRSSINGIQTNGWASDFGMLLRLNPWLTAGATLKDFYQHNVDLPMTTSLGLSGYHKNQSVLWSIQADYENETKKELVTSFGTEFYLTDSLVLRSGFKQDLLSVGGSMRGGRFLALDVSVSKAMNQPNSEEYSLAANLGNTSVKDSYRNRFAVFNKSNYAVFSLGSNLINGKSEFSIFGGEKLGSNDLLRIIHELSNDKSCDGFVIRIGSFNTSLSSLALIEEIREELLKAKKSGKKIYVYLEGYAGLPEYYLASVADQIIMPVMGGFGQFGLKLEIDKMSEFFSKLGIQRQLITSGEYKGSTSPSSRDLSYIDRKVLTTLVESLFSDAVSHINSSRTNLNQALLFLSDGKLITAQKALELTLIDHTGYWPDLPKLLDIPKDSLVPIADFIQDTAPKSIEKRAFFIPNSNRIAIIEIDGAIQLGNNATNILFGGHNTGADEIDDMVEFLVKQRSIRAVILRVNSPGGSILAADRIYKAIQRLKDAGKTVYTSMGNMAASGGYYVALNSDKIFANTTTLTGSIGVISGSTSFAGLKKELGIKNETIKTGQYMDLFSTSKDMSDDEISLLQEHQDIFYRDFVLKVKRHRGLTEKEVYAFAQGQLISGEQALQYHLIDGIGNFYDVVNALSKELNIDEPQLVFMRKQSNFTFPFRSSGTQGATMFNTSFLRILKELAPNLKSLSL